MALSMNDLLTQARLQAEGIKDPRYADILASMGITEQDANKLTETSSELTSLDSQQEKLKADLKLCTSALNEKKDDLYQAVIANKKRIKLVIPQSAWVEFGISDSR